VTERLATQVWVSSLIRRCFLAGGGAILRHRGDRHAGAVLLIVRDGANSLRALSYRVAPDGRGGWQRSGPAAAMNDDQADSFIARQRSFDPDLWVVEIEQVSVRDVLEDQDIED
jgi:hypothetical protein